MVALAPAPRIGITLDTLDITDTDLYVQRGYPWAEWDLLRNTFANIKVG